MFMFFFPFRSLLEICLDLFLGTWFLKVIAKVIFKKMYFLMFVADK